MPRKRLRTLAIAVVAIAIAAVGAPNRALAQPGIQIDIASGGAAVTAPSVAPASGTNGFFLTPPNGPAVLVFTIGDYITTVQVSITNRDPNVASSTPGVITTTLNIASIGGTVLPVPDLMINVTLHSAGYGSSLLTWLHPTAGPVTVTADTGAAQNVTITSGTATTTTNYASGAFAVNPAATVILANAAEVITTLPSTNVGSYTLGQTLTVSGVNVGAVGVNATFTSSVVGASPEPSTMALAGLTALGFVGYGLRRKARSE
jgi:hypothetical protein